MTAVKKKINGIGLMKWVTLVSVIITSLGSLGGQIVLPGIPVPSNTYSVKVTHGDNSKIYQTEWFGFCDVFRELEVEIEDDHLAPDHFLASVLKRPLVHQESKVAFLLLPKRIVKLFILFHSWKSFLLL